MSSVTVNRGACSATTVLIAMLAMSGCEPRDAESVPRVEPTAIVDANSLTRVADTASAVAADKSMQPGAENASERTEIIAVRSQVDALQIERDRLEQKIRSHQAAGEQRLAALRSEWASMNQNGSGEMSAADRERFAERARVEMETALMMDDEYRAQLQDLDEQIQQLQQRVREAEKQAQVTK